MHIKAKFNITSVVQNANNPPNGETSETVSFTAVTGGTPKDNDYAKATPSGTVVLVIDNPALRGQFKVGQVYTANFAPVDGAAGNAKIHADDKPVAGDHKHR